MNLAAITWPRGLAWAAVALLGWGAWQMGLGELLADPYERAHLWGLLGQHLYLVGISMLMATALGLGVGIAASRPRLRPISGVIMYFVGLGQTLPSLAILALVMSFLGIGDTPAIFALFAYSTLPIARNTLSGLLAVRPELIEAAKGMGMPPLRILWEVELPNALGVILTGFRVALVINIGTAALGYLIGAGGLGDMIFTGIALMDPAKLLAGAIPVALLALGGDHLCGILERWLVPRGLRLQTA